MGFSGGFSGGQILGSLFGGSGSGASDEFYSGAQSSLQASLGMQRRAYESEIEALQSQADLALEESQRDAENTAIEAEKFRKQQANVYNASGVLLEGSPMEVLNETRRIAGQEVDALVRRGRAQAELSRRKAAIVGNYGRAALLGAENEFATERTRTKMSSILNRPNKLADALTGLGQLAGNVDWKGAYNKLKGAPRVKGYPIGNP